MLTSLSLIFLVGLAMGVICTPPETAENPWHAGNGHCSRPLCLRPVGPIHPVHIRRFAQNGPYHHSAEGRTFPEYC